MPATPRIAITRGVPATLPRALARHPPAEPIDVARAREQHAAYVAALRGLGLRVIELAADDRFPDCCFVEDCALVSGDVALVTRPGAPSRRGEVEAVAAALSLHTAVHRMVPPATVDGGDCLRLGRRIFVGRSGRTNGAGVDNVRAVFGPRGYDVAAIDVGEDLHLKSVCSPLGDDMLLLAADTIPPAAFGQIEVVMVPHAERAAANCLAIGGTALVADGFPGTRRAVEGAGLRAVPIDASEMRKADGALTCLSILF